MAVNSRQNNLFAAEDWSVAYQAYSQVDFQAYDFDTIRNAMVEYIKTNFVTKTKTKKLSAAYKIRV